MAGPPHVPQSTSRRRPPPGGDEEATSMLKLGEFSEEETLSVAEANAILTIIEDRKKADGAPLCTSAVYTKARDYAATFARFKDRETVEQVERESREIKGISKFERAQLATLCCDMAEEARTLIPSLEGKISDDVLQAALDDISKLRDFS